MKPRQYAGLAILLTVAIIVATVKLWPDSSSGHGTNPDPPDPITIKGIAGGKASFFNDPDVVRILKERYGLTIEVTGGIGSIAMIEQCKVAEGWDFCIPQSQPASETIKANLGSDLHGSEIITNTPLVIYAWAPVADALISQGLVEVRGDVYYLTDLPRLVQMITDGVAWEDIGLPQLYGPVSILSSDPTKSSSGNTWAALLGSILNDGKVLDKSSVETIGPELPAFFNRLLPGTSTELFAQLMSMGMGASPLTVLYESHLLEYSLSHPAPKDQEFLADNIRTLYPLPTVWSTQQVIALTEGGSRLVPALRDPEIQAIGWSNHAFRPSVPGVLINTTEMGVSGLPDSIDSVIQLPKPDVWNRMLEILQTDPAVATPQANNLGPWAETRSRRPEYT